MNKKRKIEDERDNIVLEVSSDKSSKTGLSQLHHLASANYSDAILRNNPYLLLPSTVDMNTIDNTNGVTGVGIGFTTPTFIGTAHRFQSFKHDYHDHKMAQYLRGSRKEGDNRRKRGNCRNCPNTINGKRNPRQTSWYCTKCNVTLHPECFQPYHDNLKGMSIPEEIHSIKRNHEIDESKDNNLSQG